MKQSEDSAREDSEGCRAEVPEERRRRVHEIRLYSQQHRGDHFYVGVTDDLRERLVRHNSGGVPHTSKYKPWQIKTYVAFNDADQAFRFEKYPKSRPAVPFQKSAYN